MTDPTHTSSEEQWRKDLQADLEAAPTEGLVGDVDDYTAPVEDRLTVDLARFKQFPSLAGQPMTEVIERTKEPNNGAPTRTFRHVYTLLRSDYDASAATFDHRPNFGGVRQIMVTNGLRPVGDVVFDGITNRTDGKSVDLRYSVEAVPAVIATAPVVALAQIVQVDEPPVVPPAPAA